MTKALLKKQLMEAFAWVIQDKKTGKNRTGKGLISYVLLYVMIFGFVGSVFYQVADMLCEPLIEAKLGWMYFALMGLMGVLFGTLGSVFNTYATLYQAKDNDMLFAMPIPAKKILVARLSGVYALGLLYEMIVLAPAVIVYFIHADLEILEILFITLIPFVLSVFVLALSCVLGWVVALVSSKLKNQKIVTVVLSLAFLACYYTFFSRSSMILQNIILNPIGVGERIKGILYPLYHMGLAAEGNVLSMLIFTVIMTACFGVVYAVLAHSFMKLATTNRGASKIKYIEKKAKTSTPNRALLRKEFKRFFGSTGYMLNCGLGIVFMLIAAVVLVIKHDVVMAFGVFEGYEDLFALIAVAAICMMTTMNDISAPSVSLEGKQIWLTQVLPVSGGQVLIAKLNMHLILTLIPAAILTICVEWLLKPSPLLAILIPVAVSLFVLFTAIIGLVVNLKFPNLNWTSEMVPIKQSAGVMVALFGGWVVVLALCFAYYLLMNRLTPVGYLLCVTAMLLVVDIAMLRWIITRGARIFETL